MMAVVASPTHRMSTMRDENVMDTRTPSPVQRTNSAESNNAQYKPDLSAEVALLSTKLVNAINYQTNLDDSLQQSRHELQHTRQQLARVQAEKKHLDDMLSAGLLVQKIETDKAMARLRAELVLERAAKEAAEKAKKQTEGELENLTSALFEEANTMVAAARKDAESVEKKNAQLRSQLEDTELLLASQQEQLQDLKATMERLQKEGQIIRDPSTPSTPINMGASVTEASQPSPTTPSNTESSPEHPLYFSSLITPVLRNDTTAFGDFQDLLVLARRLGAHSRTNSNNSTHNPSAANSSIFPSVNPSSNLPGSFSLSTNSSPSSSMYSSNNSIPPLKESKFYKRVLTEDIEPTLRLDLAPGLSFLSRRTVVSSLLQGTLAVEPFPQNKHYYACALCGESRRTETHVRRHRFKTSEDDTVPKPVCDYCVARVRTTADFVGFLRVVRDGHWKCDSEEDHSAAWEESIRLRERMFWARQGGGVVPCFQQSPAKTEPPSPSTTAAVKSARQSLESIPETKSIQLQSQPSVQRSGDASAPDVQVDSGSVMDIARAIVNMSSGAAVTAIPTIEPAQDHSTSPEEQGSGFVTPTETSEDALPAETETMKSQSPTEIIADQRSEESPVIPDDEPSRTEQPSADPSEPEKANEPESNPRPDSLADAPESPDESRPASVESRNPSQPPSRPSSVTPESNSQHRKSSGGVLARVRAMEAKAQSSPSAA